MQSIFIGRQPVFDRRCKAVAYELFYRRDPADQQSRVDDPVVASSAVAAALLDGGLARLVHGRGAFINCDLSFVRQSGYELLPREQLILDLGQVELGDSELSQALVEIHKKGYRVAVSQPAQGQIPEELLRQIDIVRFDFKHLPMDSLAGALRHVSASAQSLAEKIELHDHFELACDMGFDLFQGYFFARPKNVSTGGVPVSRLRALQHFASAAGLDDASVQRIFTLDVSASLRLLRFVNSAALALSHQVDSVAHAAKLVGTRELRKILEMMALAQLAADAPAELLRFSLIRARFFEHLAPRVGGDKDRAFSLGLLSMIDALMDQPLDEVLETVAIHPQIKKTLLGQETPLYPLLVLAHAYERGAGDTIDVTAKIIGVDRQQLAQHYIEAVTYAEHFFKEAYEPAA